MNLFDGKFLPLPKAFIPVLTAVISYNLAALNSGLIGLLPIYFLSLLYLAKVENIRFAFYLGWLTALLTFAFHIRFLLNIFGNASVILWIIISFWPALFVLISRMLLYRVSKKVFLITAPSLFFVIEVISAELYPLRFSWTAAGYMTAPNSYFYFLGMVGVYGFSLIVIAISLLIEGSSYRKVYLPILMILLSGLSYSIATKEGNGPRISGIQFEFPELVDVINGLNKIKVKYPDTDIYMLSEYTFNNGIPEPVKFWCRENKAYLIAGTTFKTDDKENFYNTATIVNPNGEIEFRQAKAQPIQFFKDGLPAPEQKLWNSPWGKIGLCICYDLSYTTAIDQLVDLGAQALIVPTMDVESWGKSEHELHERVAPVRAVEYGIPIFKVASSGISQSVNSKGKVIASAPFPGQGEIISSKLTLSEKCTKPVDRYIFWPCTLICFYGFYMARFKKPEPISEF